MIVVVVQARMGSTRLPGKVLLPVAGRPMLSYQLERLRRCRRVDRIVVATSVLPADDAVVAFCEQESTAVVRGPELDVLARFELAAQASGADTVVRVTADCPLLEPALVDQAIETFAAGDCDYLSNMRPPTWPYGMAVEVMSRRALGEAAAEARDPAEREHVTPFLYWRPARYRLRSITRQPDLSALRWTVDTPEDFELVSRILGALYPVRPHFTSGDVLALLQRHPDWIEINRHVEQKTVAPSDEEPR
jgi:spore coat polysaccharide biosynthesis protein SpsF